MFAISVFDRSTYVDTPVGSKNEDFCSQYYNLKTKSGETIFRWFLRFFVL